MTNILRVRTQGIQTAGNPMLSTHYFGMALDPQAAADAVAAFWADLADILQTDSEFTVLPEVDEINVVGGVLEDVHPTTPNDPVGGTATGQPLPFATQGLIALKTGVILGGRKVAGRIFIPAMTENFNDAGVPNSDCFDTLQTAANNLIEASGSHWVVWSRKNHAAAVITSGEPWAEWAVQRSRRA